MRFWILISAALPLAACAGTQPQAVAGTAPVLAAEQPKAPSDESLTIDFQQAGTSLSDTANRQLDGAARLYRDARPEVMIIAGHSDPTGQEYRNLLLSARRAELVKGALVARGVPADRLQIVAIGQAEPVPGMPPMRSVVVTWR